MGPYNFETNNFGDFNHDKNYIVLCIEITSLRKITKPCQNILQTFS